MKKLLGILVLGLLWCNVGIAAEREPGQDQKCRKLIENKSHKDSTKSLLKLETNLKQKR